MATYTVKSGQSIYDIAVEVYGDVMGIEHILTDNAEIDLETYLAEDSTLEVFPNSSTILNANISRYFNGKTITNAEILSELDEFNGIVSYGELVTQNVGGNTYVDEVMWGNNSVNLSNTGLLLDKFNFDRISFSEPIILGQEGDFFELDFTYNDLAIDQYLVGSDDGSSIRIISDKISLYSSGKEFEFTHPTVLIDGAKYRLRVERTLIAVGGVLEKAFGLSVDGYFEEKVTSSGEVRMNKIGGEDGSRGYEGIISYLNINGNVFNFLKEGGKYIYKTR